MFWTLTLHPPNSTGPLMFVQTLDTMAVTFAERRRAVRRRPAQGTVCRLTDADGDDLGCGLVWNLSATGVSMLLHLRLEPGTQLTAELVNAAGDVVCVGLNVVHLSRLRTGDFVLGGQFSRPLCESEFLPFVLQEPLPFPLSQEKSL
jgi:hypothetical protein